MRSKKSTHPTRVMAARALAVLGISIATAAMLVAARQASAPVEMPPVAAPPQIVSAEPTAKAPGARAQAKRTAASKAPAARTLPVKTPMAAATAAKAPAAESAANPLVQEPADVTVTGCLERDDETFRLKDTTGMDAPKSRSWKSGFLKKGSASIAVVDAANRQNLGNHVGQRVSLTGTLVDREMRVRSLRRVAESCD